VNEVACDACSARSVAGAAFSNSIGCVGYTVSILASSVPAGVTHAVPQSRLSSYTPYLGLSGYGASRTCARGTARCEVMEGCWRVPSKIVRAHFTVCGRGRVSKARAPSWLTRILAGGGTRECSFFVFSAKIRPAGAQLVSDTCSAYFLSQACPFFFFSFFIEPHGVSHGKLNQPSPQYQADIPQSVKVYGRIEGHSNL
jgi:hypothetical protein